jgi:WXXGXW repeat (2 copies)
MKRSRSFILAAFLALPLSFSFGQVGISVNFAPPVLPVYEQPFCPVAGYIWTPGYWAWDGDYYWVPGVWVPPPSVGLLWTPPWWGWNNGAYVFNQGYWGPRVGFYGGINYGYGYTGSGYWGGRWSGNTFQYNTAVTRVNTNIVHNTYINNPVNKQVNANRASFNGPNGIKAEPTAEQKTAAANAKKTGPTSQQLARQQAASKDQNLRASVNKGNPNADAIKSFNKGEGAGQGQGAKGLGTAAEARAGQSENKLGNMPEHNRQGAGAGQGLGEKGLGTAAGAGKGENKPGNVTQRNLQGTGAGNAEAHGNKHGTETPGNKRNLEGNQAKAHSGKTAGYGGPAHGPYPMTQKSRRPETVAYHPQTGGKHPQAGGKGAKATGQQQGKKKKGKPEQPHGHH